MAPNTTLHCIRHAQGYHNLSVENHSLRDPQLTPKGQTQCATLHRNFPAHLADSIDLIVASPLRRTLDTALLSFADVIERKKLRVIALPTLQETSDLPCDTGSEPDVLRKLYEGKPVEFGEVGEGWEVKRMKNAPEPKAIERRAREARVWLLQRPEKNIVVVTHGGFLHYFTEDWTGAEKFLGTGWANTEFRSYTFSSLEPEDAHLTETTESKQRRSEQETRTTSKDDPARHVQRIQMKLMSRRRDDIGGW